MLPRMHLDKDDYIEGYIYQGDSTACDLVTGSSNTRMDIKLVRETWENVNDDGGTAIDRTNFINIQTTYKRTVSLWVW